MTEIEAQEGHTEPEKVIIRGIRGTVKWFSLYNHYGFINREDNGKDVFVHLSGIIQRGKTRYALEENQEVEMDVASGIKGEKAIAVTAIGGLPIENTRIARFNRRGGPRRNKEDQEVETADEGEDQPEGEKRSKKRFNRRRRGSSTNEDQAGGDAEKSAAQVEKPTNGGDAKKDAPSDKPKTEGDAKKDASLNKPQEAKPKTEGDAKKEAPLNKPSAETTNGKKDSAPVQKPSAETTNGKKESAPKGDQSKPKISAEVKKVEPTSEKPKSKPEEAKKVNESGDKAADKPEERRASVGQSIVTGAAKIFGAGETKDSSSKTGAK